MADYKEQIQLAVQESDYILVGIGEEWESKELTEPLRKAYKKLGDLLNGTDYFLVTTAVDGWIHEIGFESDRLVAPCGNRNRLQCSAACTEKLWGKEEAPETFCCPDCGAPLAPNTIEAKPYVEAGYLAGWQAYMSWLQKSLNRKLFLLELGVGFRTPTVIRWPFEKTAYLNQKSTFYRVHENLSQLPENLKKRSRSVAQNSVTWVSDNLA